jgi:hypothetical protein
MEGLAFRMKDARDCGRFALATWALESGKSGFQAGLAWFAGIAQAAGPSTRHSSFKKMWMYFFTRTDGDGGSTREAHPETGKSGCVAPGGRGKGRDWL